MNCFLCLKETEIYLNVFEGLNNGFICLDIPNIIGKYVNIKPTQNNPNICDFCWKTIENFYIFCIDIQRAQQQLYVNISTNFEEKTEIDPLVETRASKRTLKDSTYYLNENNIKCEVNLHYKEDNNINSESEANDEDKYDKDFEISDNNSLLSDNSLDQDDTVKDKYTSSKKSIKFNASTDILNDQNIEMEKSNEVLRKSTKKELDEIDKKISAFMKLECDKCEEIFPSLAELKFHSRNSHQQKGYVKCCNKKFYKRYLLVDHIECHRNPEHFKCDLCNKTFTVNESLKKHMKDIHEDPETTYICEICTKIFTRKKCLQKHKAIHIPQEQWKFNCTQCDKVFASGPILTSHVIHVHRKQTKICDLCGKTLSAKSFITHMRSHAGTEEKIECKICNTVLKKMYFKTHMKNHEESNLDHICSICGKNSPNNKALYKHIYQVHNNNKLHTCTICNKSFSLKEKLIQHMPTHTGEKNYQCNICSDVFSFKSNLYQHKKKDHPMKFEQERITKTVTSQKFKNMD